MKKLKKMIVLGMVVLSLMSALTFSVFSAGNVYEGTDRKKIQNLQKNISSLYESCQHCDVKNYCSAARCSLINKLATGDFHRPTEIECNLTNILYEVNGIC